MAMKSLSSRRLPVAEPGAAAVLAVSVQAEDFDVAALQRELLDAMADLVEPGGLLVYATCSLEPEENEAQIESFLIRHGDFRMEPPEPTWVPDEATDENGYLRVLPWKWNTDGAFASRLRRS